MKVSLTAICATAVLAILVDAINGLRPYLGSIKLKKGKSCRSTPR